MNIFLRTLLAHLYCLFNSRLKVCHGPDWIGCENNSGVVMVITWPVWYRRKNGLYH